MLILTSSSNFVTKDFLKHLPQQSAKIKLTFIPTAAEVEDGDMQWLEDDRQALRDVGFDVTNFSLTGKTKAEVKQMLDETDGVFVSGGNTFFLLQEMRKSGFTELIHEYVKNGLLYIGSSAGSVVTAPNIELIKGLDDPADAPELKEYTGLELFDAIIFPHWGSDHFKKRYMNAMESAYKKGQKIILLTDDQYVMSDGQKYSIESI